MIPTIWHSEKGKTMETIKTSVVDGDPAEEGMNRWNTETFRVVKNSLCDFTMKDTCHYTFVQTHRMTHQNWPL